MVCLESNCGNLNYTISNVEIHAYKMLPGMPGVTTNVIHGMVWEDQFRRQIESGEYRVMVPYWDWYQNTPVQITGDYLIPVKTAGIKSIVTVESNVNNVGNPQVDDTMNTFLKNAVSQYQLKVFTLQYPEQPVECRVDAKEAYMFYLNFVNAWRMEGYINARQPDFPNAINDVPVEIDEFNTTAFAMIADFRSERYHDVINPIFNTDTSTTDTRFYLRYDVAPPVGTCLYHFVESNAIFGLTSKGETLAILN
jgi:hypothetical protein